MNKTINCIGKSICSLASDNIYITALIIAIINTVLFYLELISFNVNTNIYIISSAVLSIGFLKWIYPAVMKIWSKGWGKFFVVIVNILSGLISMILSRNLVSLTLGLPAQDFDISVYTLSLIYYIPVLLALLSIILIIFIFILFVISIFFIQSRIILKNYSASSSFRLFCHFAGAIAIAFFLFRPYSMIEHDKAIYYLERLVLLVAYFGDYQPASNYPKIPLGERIRLHENGVISTASIIDWNVTIEVGTYE